MEAVERHDSAGTEILDASGSVISGAGFDYTVLPPEKREEAIQRTSDIKVLIRESEGMLKRTLQNAIATGEKLIVQKKLLGHGNYLPWLKAEFAWSDETARRTVSTASKFHNLWNLSVDASAAYLLSSPKVDTAYRAAVARAEDGEHITYSVAVDLIEGKRAAKEKEKAEEEEVKAAEFAARPQDERCQLYLGKFQTVGDVIADESIDCIITDPPYAKEHLALYSDLAAFAARKLKPGGTVLALSGQSYLPEIHVRLGEYLTYCGTLVLLLPGGQSVQLWDFKLNTFWKPIVRYAKGDFDGPWIGDVLRSDVNDNDKRFHQWGQSESGMRDLVERCSQPDDVVCDPFMGGGTTGLVCQALGRRFIGIERDEAAYSTACERLTIREEAAV